MTYKAGAYQRLSKEDGDKSESDSIANQRKIIEYFLKNKMDIEIYDEYIDDGYTGTNFNRPGFMRMIDDIISKKINCVIVKDLSRLGRDYLETGKYMERFFPQNNIRFISIGDNLDSIKQSYDMTVPFKNIINEQYSRDMSAKIQGSFKAKQKSGEFIGAFASYGYIKDPKNKHKLIVDEYAASIVRRIFSMYTHEGKGKISISSQLNAEGWHAQANIKTKRA